MLTPSQYRVKLVRADPDELEMVSTGKTPVETSEPLWNSAGEGAFGGDVFAPGDESQSEVDREGPPEEFWNHLEQCFRALWIIWD